MEAEIIMTAIILTIGIWLLINKDKLELEAEYQRGRDDVLSRSCEECKWEHIIAKDSKENPLFYACFSCSRAMPDKWEQK